MAFGKNYATWHSVEGVNTAPLKSNNRMLLWAGIAAAAILAAVVFALALPGATSGGNYSVVDKKVTIESAAIGNLGTVLATDQGYALYTFLPDAQQGVTCYDRCALNWPPVFLEEGVTTMAGSDLDASLLSDATDRNGKRVATYNGWPLYLYLGDVIPGTAVGQGQYLDGGYWYVIRPSGDVVTPAPPQ